MVHIPRFNGVTAPPEIVQLVGVIETRETDSNEDDVALSSWVEESTRIGDAVGKVMVCDSRVRWGALVLELALGPVLEPELEEELGLLLCSGAVELNPVPVPVPTSEKPIAFAARTSTV